MAHYYFLIALNALLWSSKDVFSKLVLFDTDPMFVAMIFAWTTTIYAGAFILFKKGSLNIVQDWRSWKPAIRRDVLLLIIASTIAFLCAFYTLELISPGLFSFIDSTAFPIILTLLAAVMVGDRVSPTIILAIILSAIGLIIFQSTSLSELNLSFGIGHLLGLVTSAAYATCMALVRRLRLNDFAAEKAVFYRFFLLDIALPVVLLARSEVHIGRGSYWLPLISFFGMAVSLYLTFYILGDVPAYLFAVMQPLVPIFAYLLSLVVIPQEQFLYTHLIGGTVMSVGIILGMFSAQQE